jgi:hypothetical protein
LAKSAIACMVSERVHIDLVSPMCLTRQRWPPHWTHRGYYEGVAVALDHPRVREAINGLVGVAFRW